MEGRKGREGGVRYLDYAGEGGGVCEFYDDFFAGGE